MKRLTRRAIGGMAATAVFVAAFVPFSCLRRPSTTQAPSEVVRVTREPQGIEARPARVLLADRRPTVTVAVAGGYSVLSTAGGAEAPLAGGPSLAATAVRPGVRGIHFGSQHMLHNELRLVPRRDGTVAVDGRRYRGELLVRREGADALSVVNVVPVDSYLYSVLGSETYAGWPPAALEAQAIVARTYALWRMADRKRLGFDLYATSADQNYRGVAKEDPRLRDAVDRTYGVVLLYQMKLFRCYYHSTCGGRTEAVEHYFPAPPLLPLSGAECGYCTGSKHYRWEREIPKAELAEALRKEGLAVARLVALEVASRTRAGRARELAVESSDGVRLRVPAGKFRAAVGARRLPSTWFEIRDLGDRCAFRGRGWGHGVGLCQWGAKGMADAGCSAAQILSHYYTGATIQRVYSRHGP